MRLDSWSGPGKGKGWGPKERVFGPQLPKDGFWQRTAPLAIVRAYRKIPDPVRGTWSMGSSTSHLAEEAIAAGGGWEAFRRFSGGWKFLPTYALGAGIRHAGLAPAVLRAAPVVLGADVKDGIPGWIDGSTSLGRPPGPNWFWKKEWNIPGTFVSNGWSDTPKVPGSFTQVRHAKPPLPGWDKPGTSLGADVQWQQVAPNGAFTAIRRKGGPGIDWLSGQAGTRFTNLELHTPPPLPGWMRPKGSIGLDVVPGGWFTAKNMTSLGSGRGSWKLDTSLGSDWDTPRNTLKFFLATGLLAGLGLSADDPFVPFWLQKGPPRR